MPTDVPGVITGTSLKTLWKRTGDGGSCEFAVELTFPDSAITACGAPQTTWLNVSVTSSNSANVVLGLFNKTQTRLPYVYNLYLSCLYM